ncbi:FAD/NAD(P)-binding protein [Microbacterium karelineae]|uniref:FAD/NAD(P)-binding protein n=1 Tax=Microbacterium karelineae TaxID=2654283 RepID=UPI0012EA6857|nr:FAD/NAD(P)-binding protein [Microbacterium karelineae]
MHNEIRAEIAVIGGGPRGVSLLERITAAIRDGCVDAPHPLTVHIVDDVQVGAGRIWRTDQTRELCMNTLAGAVTLFTDASVTMKGSVVPGPTLYEWAVLAYGAQGGTEREDEAAEVAASHCEAFLTTPVRTGFASDYDTELRTLRPESHPSRALYGEYISWAFDHAVALRPAGVEVVSHIARAIDITTEHGRQVVSLDTGAKIEADAVILATGWMPRRRTPAEGEIARAVALHPGLVWVRPDSPVDQELHHVPGGVHAIVRGLGMGFFDAMALLTLGRGGRFDESPSDPGGLRYIASGREPILHVTSHRGLPYRAKSLYGGLPPRAGHPHLRGVDWDAVARPIDVDSALWPLVVKDAFAAYYETLHRVRPAAFTAELDDVLEAIGRAPGEPGALDAVVESLVPDVSDRLDLAAAVDPTGDTRFDSPGAFGEYVARYLAEDLAESATGTESPLKAALWSISSARQPVSVIGAFGGFDAESRASGFRRILAVGGMVGSGPPAFRNRQLLALVAAGLVRFIGPAAQVTIENGRFRASSPVVEGSAVEAPVLIDAWMRFHDLSASADPLVASLLSQGRVRSFDVRSRTGHVVATGAMDIDPATGLLIGADGTPDAAIHVSGIPIEEAMHDSIISPMPGADATMLRETDRVARSAVRIALGAFRPTDVPQ